MEKLYRFEEWLASVGVSSVTGWRWQKKGLIELTRINTRKYVTDAAIARWKERIQLPENNQPNAGWFKSKQTA